MNKQITKAGLTLVFMILVNLSIYPQIGVYTENVSNNLILHIDPAKNNPITGAPSATQATDDIVVDINGNVGIGTITPETKLHIATGGTSASPNPQLRIEDGRQLAKRVLTSGHNGEAIWQEYAPGAVLGSFSLTGINITLPLTGTTFKNTGSKLTLPPGLWAIVFSIEISCVKTGTTPAEGSRIWVRSTFGDDTSLNAAKTEGSVSADIEGINAFDGLIWVGGSGILTGRCVVNNTSGIEKDYYYLVGDITNYQNYTGLTLPNVGAKSNNNSMAAFRVAYY